MDLLFFILIFVIGFMLGEAYAMYTFRKIIRKIAQSQGVDLDKEIRNLQRKEDTTKGLEIVHRLETENIDNILYLYNRDTKDFICQGSTLDELVESARRYKNINYGTIVHDNQVFVVMEGKVEEYQSDEN